MQDLYLGNIIIFAVHFSPSNELYSRGQVIACKIVNSSSLYWKFHELNVHLAKKASSSISNVTREIEVLFSDWTCIVRIILKRANVFVRNIILTCAYVPNAYYIESCRQTNLVLRLLKVHARPGSHAYEYKNTSVLLGWV